MSEAAQKSKKIAKAGAGRQVRLWVRAKFLSFRRYHLDYLDQRSPKIPTRPSSASRESMIVRPLNTISERESPTSTKPTQARPRTGSEPSGAGSPEATEIVEPFWQGSPPTCPPEPLDQPLELCSSPREADLILFKHHYPSITTTHYHTGLMAYRPIYHQEISLEIARTNSGRGDCFLG